MRKSLAIVAISGVALLVALVVWRAWARIAEARQAPPTAEALARGVADPVRAAELLFGAGYYAEGRKLLVDASAEKRRDHQEYARILMALGAFYERHVGDSRRVAGYLREIDNLRLAPGDPVLEQLGEMRKRLAALDAGFGPENAVLARASSYEPDGPALRRRIEELTALTASRREYPRLAQAYHYLGESYLQLKDYRQAYRSFGRALELRPAIEFSLPTKRREAEALEQWARRDLARSSRALLAGLLALAAVLLVRSKPWRWLGLRHAVALGALLGSWWLLFRLSVRLMASTIPKDLSTLPPPTFVQTGLGTPLSGPLDELFGYGLWAVGGAFAIALVTAQHRPRWTAAFAGGVATLLFVSSLMTQFVLGQRTASFQVADSGSYRYLRGALLFPLSSGQEPYMLTDPKGYCGFQANIVNMDEPETRDWFRQYASLCP